MTGENPPAAPRAAAPDSATTRVPTKVVIAMAITRLWRCMKDVLCRRAPTMLAWASPRRRSRDGIGEAKEEIRKRPHSASAALTSLTQIRSRLFGAASRGEIEELRESSWVRQPRSAARRRSIAQRSSAPAACTGRDRSSSSTIRARLPIRNARHASKVRRTELPSPAVP